MSGRVEDLSPKQAEALEQFRERIQDILPQLPAQHDHFLLRWLRARNFNTQKSEAMLRKHLEFRKQMKVDAIITDWRPPEVIEKYLSGGMCGHDREGSPVWYDVIGPVDPKGLFLSASKQDFIKSKIRDCEVLQQECDVQSQKLGRNVESITMIYDVEGLGLKHLWKPAIETYTEILQMFEANYPEGLKRLFVIKAPKLFPVAYNLVKHFLSENTRQKINILGANWQEVLMKYIDAEELPVIYGGKLTDPDGDPRCRTMIHHVSPVPPSYYVRDHVKMEYEQCTTVSRGSSQQLDYEILFPGCVLRWQFASEGADIGFGVFVKAKKGEKKKAAQMEEVVLSQRYNAHLVPEDGSLTCERPGVYVLRFDNTYSMFQAKRISFTVEVLLPERLQSPQSNGGSKDTTVQAEGNSQS
ncbi:SEC14-like lipid binding 8 [Gymnodraco acuticeps]|uniref:SEC14-like lipid binding 8 n=1 Tax=Gymnodraco acuticeps TaxID=8218 RepID=A0A6P8U709_GYMAC|nr:SEC14-like lipid binding 8 [Gymnodraco acuticeps]